MRSFLHVSPILVFIVTFQLMVSTATAKLEFLREEVHYKAGIGEASFTAIFPFKNVDEKDAVILLGAASDCDCTVPEFEGAEYLPGESGLISATFKFGEYKGINDKRIIVQTNEGSYSLLLSVEIPEFWRVSSDVLMWKKGEANPETKEFEISFNQLKPKELSIENRAKQSFTVEWDWAPGGESCHVRVKPKHTQVSLIKKIEVKVVYENGVSMAIPLLLRIID